MSKAHALLVAMLDADVDDVDEFNRWYDDEHIPERLACPGFISARRFRAIEGRPEYLTVYELTGPEALRSPEYLALSERRSELSQRMVGGMRNLVRNVYVELDRERLRE